MNEPEVSLPYIDFGTFLRRYFPEQKVQKITLTAGFTLHTRYEPKDKGGYA